MALYPLLPDKMQVYRDDSGELYYIYTKSSDENPNLRQYGQVRLSRYDVLHIPGLGFDGLVGYSPIAMAKNAVGISLACEEYGASFFANGANPSGVLEHPGILKDPAKVRDSWNEVYRGSSQRPQDCRFGGRHEIHADLHFTGRSTVSGNAEIPDRRDRAALPHPASHGGRPRKSSFFQHRAAVSGIRVKYTLDPWVIRWEQA